MADIQKANQEANSVKDEQSPVDEIKSKPAVKVQGASGEVDIKKLLEVGAHFGHKTSRWHPKMAPYIHSKRGGIHIIDLTKTAIQLEAALAFLEQTAAEGKQVLFVGTKRQARDIVRKAAESVKMPFVTERWLGGMLTNWNTIGGRVKYLKDQEAKMESGQLVAKHNKLEVQRFQEEIDEMNQLYGGIKNMTAKPAAMYMVDVLHEANAVREAKRLDVPIVAVVDTNVDPTDISYPIPANDDAIKTIQLITDYVRAAIEAGKAKYAKKQSATAEQEAGNKKKVADAEPSTEDKPKVAIARGNG